MVSKCDNKVNLWSRNIIESSDYFLFSDLHSHIETHQQKITETALGLFLKRQGYRKVRKKISVSGKKITVTCYIINEPLFEGIDDKNCAKVALGLKTIEQAKLDSMTFKPSFIEGSLERKYISAPLSRKGP